MLFMSFIPAIFSLLTSLCFNVQASQLCQGDGTARTSYTVMENVFTSARRGVWLNMRTSSHLPLSRHLILSFL